MNRFDRLPRVGSCFGRERHVPRTSAARDRSRLYPELLNWLAYHFMDSGLECEGTVSKTRHCDDRNRAYRQRSIADAKTMEDDPENDWLGARAALPSARRR